jgi:hypothetical protein
MACWQLVQEAKDNVKKRKEKEIKTTTKKVSPLSAGCAFRLA